MSVLRRGGRNWRVPLVILAFSLGPPAWAGNWWDTLGTPGETFWESDELPGVDSAARLEDGSPAGHGHPCEIYSMFLSHPDPASGTFKFSIQTNFGDLTARQAYDSQHPGLRWRDSYKSGFLMSQVTPGDLYIRVRNQPNIPGLVDHGDVALYGMVLESHTAYADSEMNLIYKGHLDTAGKAGMLYGGNVEFATGTYEGYVADHPLGYVPEMARAAALPGTAPEVPRSAWSYDKGVSQSNEYPTLLLSGTEVASGAVAWSLSGLTGTLHGDHDAYVAFVAANGAPAWTGEWWGGFTLPGFDPATQYVELWWAMDCGNDGVVLNPYGQPASYSVPLPGSLILCGIGMVSVGAFRLLRRRQGG